MKRKNSKNSNRCRLNNTLVYKPPNNRKKYIYERKKIYMKENKATITKNVWDTVKAVLSGRFIALQAYLKKQEKSQII